MNELVRSLKAAGTRLSKRVLDEMYLDPYWNDRFGVRGRGHSETDGDFHLKYIVSALESNDPSLFVTYSKWLREVLTSRGMCSLHLADNFDLLADAISEETWPVKEAAIQSLRRGSAGLAYGSGDAHPVDQLRATAVPALVERVVSAQPDADKKRLAADAAHLLSFLADGLAFTTDRVAPYARYLLVSYERRGIARTELTTLLAAIAELPTLPAAAKALVQEALG
ncbi:MAG TPA: hypothetical protein VGM39_17520 [Kofleriaceae bacterium]